MRINNIIKSSLVLMGLVVISTGCLKDKDFDNHKYGVTDPASQPKGIAFVQSPQSPVVSSLDISGTAQNIETEITIEADQPAATDVTVKLVANPALVTAAQLTPLPSNVYTPPSLTVTIPKGQQAVKFIVKVNSTLALDPTTQYGLGYSIASVSGGDYQIASNFKNLTIEIVLKNAYEGKYKSTGFFQHPTSPRDINKTKYLYTVNLNTIVMELGDLGAATQVYVTVNANNTVTVTPGPGAPAPNVANVAGDPVYNNTYDPATKTFYLKYQYVTSAPRVITEKLVRQ